VIALCERLRAHGTRERLFARVKAFVNFQAARMGEDFLANSAFALFGVGVDPLVEFQVSAVLKRLSTHRADVRLLII